MTMRNFKKTNDIIDLIIKRCGKSIGNEKDLPSKIILESPPSIPKSVEDIVKETKNVTIGFNKLSTTISGSIDRLRWPFFPNDPKIPEEVYDNLMNFLKELDDALSEKELNRINKNLSNIRKQNEDFFKQLQELNESLSIFLQVLSGNVKDKKEAKNRLIIKRQLIKTEIEEKPPVEIAEEQT